MRTIGSVLDEKNGISYGFDFLRVALAFGVVFVHSFGLSGGTENSLPRGLFVLSILPMFFALSGFLITSSAMRLRLRDFILNRAFRIVPALIVDIFIAALILGGIFTTLPIISYFTSTEFFTYFFNITGFIHFYLPGVFKENPYPQVVNGNLWTIPFEIGCYILISLLIRFGLLHHKRAVLALFVVISGLLAGGFGSEIHVTQWLHLPHFLENIVDKAILNYFAEHGKMLYAYFTAGCVFYLYRYKIPYSPVLLALVLVVYFYEGFTTFTPTPFEKILYILLIVYVMAFIGVSNMPRLPLFRRGDYSYGVYLYGFPLQQSIVALFLPNMISPWLLFALTAVTVTLVAMISWHFVEKPILKLRKKFSFTARRGGEIESIEVKA